MSTAATAFAAKEKHRAGRPGVSAGWILRGVARFTRVLQDEVSRIPRYQDEAEQLWASLRQGRRRA